MSESATSPAFALTGASQGIGNAIVRELLRRGVRVLGTARTKRLFGRIDGVINNVGRAYRAPASGTSFEDFRSLLEINLLAAFGLAQAAYEELRTSRAVQWSTHSVDGGYLAKGL
jgi:NAD(P)-dependent dehydrogenase (short-subunit alcohol dehydrogenase family)